MKIYVVCAWCGILLGTKESETEDENNISHSICQPCKDKAMAEIDELIPKKTSTKTLAA
jgi:hypothetical protein